jgi:hypothetical protein
MGRSYWFECSKCGYRARVSGRPDRGLDLCVETVACRECRALFDAVTRVRVPSEGQSGTGLSCAGFRLARGFNGPRSFNGPPQFFGALNRLSYTGAHGFKWMEFKVQCPVSRLHHVRSWRDPGHCPRCGIFMDKNAVPYRIWD